MTYLTLIKSIFLGIIEGMTEFIPVSSTAHLILFEKIINFHILSVKLFTVLVQSGSILAILFIFRKRILCLIYGLIILDQKSLQIVKNIIISILPSIIIGYLFIDYIKYFSTNYILIGCTLIIGSIFIIIVEYIIYPNLCLNKKITSNFYNISFKQAIFVGISQTIALIPGVSRSGATIMGAMISGIKRNTATEFSFIIAIPTILGASFYDIWINRNIISFDDISYLIAGFISAFFISIYIIKKIIKYVSHNTYLMFAWYRMILGILIIICNNSTLINN